MDIGFCRSGTEAMLNAPPILSLRVELPPRSARWQPEHHPTSRLNVGGQAGNMLYGDVDIAEETL